MKFIAEVSGNHNGSLKRALQIVHAAAASGATHLKLQTYTPDTITLPSDSPRFTLRESHPLWGSKNLYDLYTHAMTPWEWHAEIAREAKKLGLIFFSTPFDETAVDFLEEIGVELYKIASLEIIDLPLIRHVAKTGKPMIISTGAATLGEIEAAVKAASDSGCTDITLLVCTSDYPANPADANILRIPVLRDLFGLSVGLSDHAITNSVAIAATALGATVIEKHLTLRRKDGGVDSGFSLEPEEFRKLVEGCLEAQLSLGRPSRWHISAEDESRRFRPSLHVTQDVSAGEVVTTENVRSVRPSGGLSPDEISAVLGMKFSSAQKIGTPLSWKDLD